MIVVVSALLLLATLMHLLWNTMLKASGDPLAMATRAVAAGTALCSPLLAIVWWFDGRPGFPGQVWLLVCLSALVEVAYFVSLSRAYQLGDLSAVYPLARGTAPLLAVAAGVLVLHEHLRGVQAAGVVCLLVGILIIRRPTGARAATIPAVIVGVTIATYSTIDAGGVRLVAPWLYGWVLWSLTAVVLALWNLRPHADSARTCTDTPSWRLSMVAGCLMLLAYWCVLFALRLAPLSVVAPLRESAIVVAPLWGAWRLGERVGLNIRLAGAGVIALGAVLLTAGA